MTAIFDTRHIDGRYERIFVVLNEAIASIRSGDRSYNAGYLGSAT